MDTRSRFRLKIGSALFGTLLAMCTSVYGATIPAAASNPAAAAGATGQQGIITLQTDGCNSASRAPIPGTQNLFIARHYFDANGSLLSDACSPDLMKNNHFGLVLERLDWNKKQLTVLKPLLSVPMTVTGGPFKGLMVVAAYDPDVVFYHGRYWVAFECGLGNGGKYKVRGVASCMAPFNLAKQEILYNSIYVVVSGEHDDVKKEQYSASVPAFLVANDHLYLYWSVVRNNQDRSSPDFRKFYDQYVRGAELVADSGGYFWVKGGGGMAYSTGPETVEVWGLDPKNPMSDTSVDIKSLWMHGNDVIALASLGGSGCTMPNINTPGCYRMAITKAAQPLGYHIFNNSLLDEKILPTNPTDYERPIKNPDGKYFLLGHLHYPYKNGYSELRIMPPQQDWPSNVTPMKYIDVAFPFTDSALWPTDNAP